MGVLYVQHACSIQYMHSMCSKEADMCAAHKQHFCKDNIFTSSTLFFFLDPDNHNHIGMALGMHGVFVGETSDLKLTHNMNFKKNKKTWIVTGVQSSRYCIGELRTSLHTTTFTYVGRGRGHEVSYMIRNLTISK